MSKIEKFVKKPIPVPMIKWDGSEETARNIVMFATEKNVLTTLEKDNSLTLKVKTSSGFVLVPVGHYVAQGATDFYPLCAKEHAEVYDKHENLVGQTIDVNNKEDIQYITEILEKLEAYQVASMIAGKGYAETVDQMQDYLESRFPELAEYKCHVLRKEDDIKIKILNEKE